MNECVWNIGAMLLTGESHNTLRKTCPNATLSNTNLSVTGPLTVAGFPEYDVIVFGPRRSYVSSSETVCLPTQGAAHLGAVEVLLLPATRVARRDERSRAVLGAHRRVLDVVAGAIGIARLLRGDSAQNVTPSTQYSLIHLALDS
jgi:hypothetical protein